MVTQTFSKFTRPEQTDKGRISDRDLDIVEAILRYRFSPTSELVRLVGGNEDVTQRRLRKLWEWQLVNRFAFPGIRTHSEFHYYLDNRRALELLVEHGRLNDLHPLMLEELRNNREKNYADTAFRGQHMQLGFLKHSLQISRMHFLLEMAARSAAGEVQLRDWRQGTELRGHKVEMPAMQSRRQESNTYLWEEQQGTERLPVEPDALFTLRFHNRQEVAHFCYEADRGTMNATDMLQKLRAYVHFIKRQQKHKEAFGVHPIRAVLIETTDEQRAQRLMELVHHPLVCGPNKRAGLFWFTISPVFTDRRGALAAYLVHPEFILDSIWALPDRSLHRLTDPENSTPALPS
jgi:hypothetical protein